MSSSSASGKRIVVTGGSGKAGRYIIPYLQSQGHTVLNLDLSPFPTSHGSVYTLKTDLTDSGQVFNALTSLFSMSEYTLPSHPGSPDAVIHLAAYARNMLVPDSELFRANTQSTYNVIEAACKLGVKKVIIASSETVYGVCFAQGADPEFHSYPLDEESYDVDPEDSYACSKLCGERVGRSFARRFGADVYALRIGNVIEPLEYGRDFPGFVKEPGSRKRNAWSYVDARDLGQICDLAVGKDGLGFQVFNATNDGVTTKEDTMAVLERFSPGVKVTREMGVREAPLSNKKVKEVLGFREKWHWLDILKSEGVAI